jgi:hypothetical protein
MIAPCWAERVEGAPPAPAADAGAVPPGCVPHFLRFEEALFAQHATASFAFPVAPAGEAEAGGASAAAAASAAAPAPAAAGARGGKRPKRADDDNDGDDDAVSSRATLRTPLFRRVLLFPVAALERVARTAAQNLAATKADVLREQAAAQKSGGVAGVGAERAKQLPPAPAGRKSAKRAP